MIFRASLIRLAIRYPLRDSRVFADRMASRRTRAAALRAGRTHSPSKCEDNQYTDVFVLVVNLPVTRVS